MTPALRIATPVREPLSQSRAEHYVQLLTTAGLRDDEIARILGDE